MKVVSKGWIAKLGTAVLASFLVMPVHAQLMLAHEGHHDAGGCSIRTGDFPVTFSAYEVPEGDLPPLHSYCENIPNTGKVNLTIELPPVARETPLAVRVVMDGHGGHGGHAEKQQAPAAQTQDDEHAGHEGHEGMDHDAHAGHDAVEEHGVVYMPPEEHRSGIIVIAANLTERGSYKIQLERKDDSGNVKTVVTIPLNVGKGGGHGSHGGGIGFTEIALLLILGGGGAFYYMRRKKESEASS